MNIIKKECFIYSDEKKIKNLVHKLYGNIDNDFLFLLYKKTFKLIDEPFKYSRNKFNNLICDQYFNDGKCSIFIINSMSKNLTITTELISNPFLKNMDIKMNKDYSFIEPRDFKFFLTCFHFLLNEKLGIKNKNIAIELTYWFLFQRHTYNLKGEIYFFNLQKREHWNNFVSELKINYGKNYNQIILNLNNSIKKIIL